ncbi:WLM domain-containing protein [Rhodofomes roseus]|uniref:WLM domain-containing protein n=1 Tax=Rhodofomes roseus TaxID=34475 RepID=A0ABQ8KKW3_9APHY|nr:WLM domain-containing protein [Rhodofomes roseus]KAH9838256.1 WLM domain-containing protein [Rhodofomes roseus]
MVHVRLNERETNPNPHINFITTLPMPDAADQEDARQLLRALAAQVRPVMKAHGFVVNSFEEYEYNKVFAGRNWNSGEVVELVLRGPSGSFQSLSWLMSTLCHEHMNHGPAFQALWAKLRAEVRALQSKGYYGDGYWSSGTRLADSARVGGGTLDPGDLPENMCGGAQARKRPTSLRRRRNHQAGPSNHTGAQTAKKRKAGSRITAIGTFRGSGHALNEDASDEEQKKSGAGFRKKAGSKRAREERALAAERRLLALQGGAGPSTQSPKDEPEEDEDSDVEIVEETDQERRRAMLDASTQNDLDDMKSSRTDFSSDFIFPPMSSDDDEGPSCDIQVLPRPSATAASGTEPSTSRKGKQRASLEVVDLTEEETARPSSNSNPRKKAKRDMSYGNLIQDEMKQRKLESLGLTGNGQRLGGDRKAPTQPHAKASGPASGAMRSRSGQPTGPDQHQDKDSPEWTCLVCTL